MEELIKIRKSTKTGNPIVNGRDLHVGLKVRKDFSTWIKERIRKCEFDEDVDYVRIFFDEFGEKMTLPQKGERSSRGFGDVFRIEYALTFNTAKHIAMLQNNTQGKKVRQYFIEKEKEFWVLKEAKSVLLLTMSETAMSLSLNDYYGKVGRNTLYNILYFQKIVDKKNQPLQKYVKKGYFTCKPTRVTETGLKWLKELFSDDKDAENSELKEIIHKLQGNQQFMMEGIGAMVSTFLFNKGGDRTDEQNRLNVAKLRNFMGKYDEMQKALQ